MGLAGQERMKRSVEDTPRHRCETLLHTPKQMRADQAIGSGLLGHSPICSSEPARRALLSRIRKAAAPSAIRTMLIAAASIIRSARNR